MTHVPLIPDPGPSQATPGLFNRTFSVLSQNIDTVSAQVAGAVLSVTSTPHQITVSSATGNPVFSLPSVLSIPGTVDVMSTTSFGGNVISGLTVTGAVKLDSTLTVAGQVNSNSSLSVDGNAQIGSSITAGRESYASAFYVTAPPKGALPSVVDIGYPDVGMGFHRSQNSNTLRFSNGTFNEQGSGCNVSVLTSRSEIMATRGFWSGFDGNIGRYQFAFSGSGMNQNTSGFVFNKNASPASTRFGVDSSGNTFFIGTAASASTYGMHVTPDLDLYGSLRLNGALLSMRTRGSVDSTSMLTGEILLTINQTSGISLAFRSNHTIWYFESSASTVG